MTVEKKYYMILEKDGTSPYYEYKVPLPKKLKNEWKSGRWSTTKGDISPNENGFQVTSKPMDEMSRIGELSIFEVEIDYDESQLSYISYGDRMICRKIRLIKKLGIDEIDNIRRKEDIEYDSFVQKMSSVKLKKTSRSVRKNWIMLDPLHFLMLSYESTPFFSPKLFEGSKRHQWLEVLCDREKMAKRFGLKVNPNNMGAHIYKCWNSAIQDMEELLAYGGNLKKKKQLMDSILDVWNSGYICAGIATDGRLLVWKIDKQGFKECRKTLRLMNISRL